MIIKEKGVSILEVLIALTIGMLVMAGMVQVVSVMSQNARVQGEEADIQESLMFASNRVGYALKQSFSSVCGDFSKMMDLGQLFLARDSNYVAQAIPSSANPVISATGIKVRPGNMPLLQVGQVPAGGFPASSNLNTQMPNATAGTDYFIVMEVGEKIGINATNTTGTTAIDGVGVAGKNVAASFLRQGTANNAVFLITNCEKGDIFQAAAIDNAFQVTMNNNVVLSAEYNELNSMVTTLDFFAYYIGTDGNGRIGLRRRDLITGFNQPLVDGISDIKINWGLGTDLTTQAYFSSQQIEAGIASGNFTPTRFLNNIVSADITYTIQSLDEGTAISQQAGRQQASQLVAIRNKIAR